MTIDFESDLRAKMAGIKPVLPPGLAQEVAASHRRHQQRRRKAAHALMAVVPAVALVAGGAAVVAHGTGGASPAATHPAVLTADYVKKKVESTLSSGNIDNYIIESTGTGIGDESLAIDNSNIIESTATGTGDESFANWVDSATGHIQWVQKSANATVTSWMATYKAGSQWYTKSTVVDTAAKTVTTSTFQGQAGVVGLGGFFGDSDYRQALATGQATIAGKSVIDGQSVIDLHLSKLSGMHAIDGAGSTVATVADFWVNSQNFQLVKLVWGEASHPITSYFHWFPRTKALVAQVDTPQIPAGYRQVGTSK